MPFGGYAGGCPIRLGGSPEEGLTAAQYLRAAADLAAMRRVVPFAVIVIDQGVGDPSIVEYWGQNGVGTADRPAISWVAASNAARLTWPTYWVDRSGRRHQTHIKGAVGNRVEPLEQFTINAIDLRQINALGDVANGAIYTVEIL